MSRASRYRLRCVALMLLLASACVLGGCGQKGDLYLPDKTNTPRSNS